MNYLLIDFGASSIKCCIYSTKTKLFSKFKNYDSPFIYHTTITKKELLNLILDILSDYKTCTRVLSCSILGGQWIDDIYYSWKELKKQTKPDCLISGLFTESPEYHIHKHHGGNIHHIKPLGHIGNVLWYSCLGDTDCVINSIDINDNEYIINIGTGSQVITKSCIHRYIPAGRALLVFDKFFQSVGINFFDKLNSINIEQVIHSNLNIDLNIFEQSHQYISGGFIRNINEYNFTLENLLGSIIKALVCQYKPFIENDHATIILTGGIPKKIKIIKNLFEYYYNNSIILSTTIAETHKGLAKFIETTEILMVPNE